MRVREIMTAPVTTLDPADTLAFAEELMNVERVRHLPVVDGDLLVGLVSQRDVLAASASTLSDMTDDEARERASRVLVSAIMRGSVETIGPEADAVEAADLLLTQKVGCLPVVDDRLHLLGIVTESDFVRAMREVLRRAAAASKGLARPGAEPPTMRPKPSAKRTAAGGRTRRTRA